MNVNELSREQLVELKQNYLCELADKRNGEGVSYGELASADELVSDDEIFDYYSGTDFVTEDFVCSGYDELPWWEKE